MHVHLFKIGLADSPLCPLCKSGPMTEVHLSDCPTLLYVISQDHCGVLVPVRVTSALCPRGRWRATIVHCNNVVMVVNDAVLPSQEFESWKPVESRNVKGRIHVKRGEADNLHFGMVWKFGKPSPVAA
ncbi:hypothetical protein TNCV_4014861 [Trichonephila clavipes]|uniref:Uncharacterized protein n=1 Tax=Trichonephila clavipes TaxID=2585209 RepID=A0A8X6RPL1_TRICX|nr:hypothetical protein TNCV_4014861 [Trichonephila clavipes]